MTVKELIEKLSKYDKNLKVVGINHIELDTQEKIEVVDNEHNVSLTIVGFETILKIR